MLATALLLLALSSSPGDLSDALTRAKIGTTIRVEAPPLLSEGKLIELTSAELRLQPPTKRDRVKPEPVVIPLESVGTVWKREGHAGWGVVIGLLVGAGVGYAVSANDDTAWLSNEAEGAIGGTILGLVGGLFGGFIGHAVKTYDIIYSALKEN